MPTLGEGSKPCNSWGVHLASRIPDDVRKPLAWDGVCSRLMDTLTGGAFLAGLGLHVGASNFVLGILASLPILAQVIQLPALALLLSIKDRRRAVIAACAVARAILAVIALLLLFAPGRLDPWTLTALLGANALLAVVATAAWNWWMRDLLPAEELGAFFGYRMRRNTVAALLAMLAAGAALDAFDSRGMAEGGYAVLFGGGALAGFAGLWFLHRTPHVAPPPSPPPSQALTAMRRAFHSGHPGALVASAGVGCAVTFALPFVAVFLLRAHGYSYLAVTGLAVVSQLAYLAGLRGWGHLADRHGDRGVLVLTTGMLAVVAAGWAVAGWREPAVLAAWVTALHFLAGFALGGVELANGNLLLKSAPADNAVAYLAAASLTRALTAGLGTLAAGALWQALGPERIFVTEQGAWSLAGFQVLATISFLLTLFALALLVRVREPRHVHVLDVALAMRREVGQMSSIAGVRGLLHAVSYSTELMAAPFAARRRRRSGASPLPVPEADTK